MQTLGIIGSGNIGSAVARLAVASGMNVIIANSRGPESLHQLIEELGPLAKAGTVEDAANDGDAIVLSIPLLAVKDLPAGLLRNKLVLDTSNYYPYRDGRITELDAEVMTTSELVHEWLVGARHVKAFSNILAHHIRFFHVTMAPPTAPPFPSPPMTSTPSVRRRQSWTGSDSMPSMPERSLTRGNSSPSPPGTRAFTSPTRAHPTISCFPPKQAQRRPLSSTWRWSLPPG